MNRSVLLSMALCAGLVFIGVVRCLSYLRDPLIGDTLRASPLGLIAYQPTVYINAQFFKVLATPSVVGLQYFAFRWFNRSHQKAPPYPGAVRRDPLDFRLWWVRLALTSLATVHWFLIEFAKFSGRENFYPWSPLEDRMTNGIALIAGQVIAFFGMKYLSFAPLRRD